MVLYPAFIDPERCRHLVKTAQARLAPSGLALRKTEGPQETECAPSRSTDYFIAIPPQTAFFRFRAGDH